MSVQRFFIYKYMMIKKGNKFNRLIAIRFIEMRGKDSRQYWLFGCICGNKKIINAHNVKTGVTKSCGCLKKENCKGVITHGMRFTKTYKSWNGMKQRCLNSNCKEYKLYGGRGIIVCEEWLKFENFYQDMGDRPKGLSLDRKDNNLGYYKENCKWSNLLQSF